MATDVLQRFLNRRLFDVGGDDARVALLRAAAADVAAVIKDSPQRAAGMTMVAIDSRIGPDEPLVGEVMKVLEKRWQSYAGAFADKKLPTLARAIVLHALSAAMGSDSIATAVSLTARTMLPQLGDPADLDLWGDIINDADRRLALRTEREWALPSAAKAATGSLSWTAPAALTPPTLARAWLVQRFSAAAGPHNSDGEANKTPVNPQFPNSGEPWSHAFAPIAATSVASAVDLAFKAFAEQIDKRDAGETLGNAITSYVSSAAETLTRTAIGLERRTALLWWKEALYSPSAHVSYRDLDPAAAAALAAIDASAQTGPFAPRMAEAMVRETLRSIDVGFASESQPLSACCNVIAETEGPVRAALEAGFGAVNREPGRTPLASLLADSDAVTPEVIAERLGLAPDLAVTPMEFGTWLFRDLQAAAATPPPVKRKRGAKGG
jgi:hypothetical protein